MDRVTTFDERVAGHLDRLGPAEQRVVRYFQDNREDVLVASASALAAKVGTSDATVVRATKALGYAGMDALRRHLAAELRMNLSPATRIAQTLADLGDNRTSILGLTLDIHVKAFEDLRRDISPELFQRAIDLLLSAQRIVAFGIGPSSAIAKYFAIQLARFGIDSDSLTQTGLLLADGLHRLRQGDLVMILAYSRVYRELDTLLDHADRLGVATILLTDTLGAALHQRVDIVLPVTRGRAERFSMHTATLGLIEALLVGVAAGRSADTVAHLKSLNDLRAKLIGQPMELPMQKDRQKSPQASKRTTRRT